MDADKELFMICVYLRLSAANSSVIVFSLWTKSFLSPAHRAVSACTPRSFVQTKNEVAATMRMPEKADELKKIVVSSAFGSMDGCRFDQVGDRGTLEKFAVP